MLPEFLLGKGLFTMVHTNWQCEGLFRFVLEVVFQWLVIWLIQAKTWQERMEVVNTWEIFAR